MLFTSIPKSQQEGRGRGRWEEEKEEEGGRSIRRIKYLTRGGGGGRGPSSNLVYRPCLCSINRNGAQQINNLSFK